MAGTDDDGKPRAAGVAVEAPPVDILGRGDSLLLRVILPGVPKENIEVMVEPRRVTITASRPAREERGVYHLHEQSLSTSYWRTVELPAPVDREGVRARLHNGVLELTLPLIGRKRRVEIH